MKYKTTAKAIREEGGNIIAIGYCGAQYLLWDKSPVAYTCGVYGWNFDVYEIDGVTICTGYRGMPGRHVDYAILEKYENAARAVMDDYSKGYEQRRDEVNGLLWEFLREVAA